MKRAPLFSLAIGVVLLFGMVVGVAVFTAVNERLTARQTRVFESGLRLSLLFSAIKDIETGQRGFLLTRDESYLAPYEAGSAALPHAIETLGEVVADDVSQLADFSLLKSLIPEKIAEVDRTLEAARAGRVAEAIATVGNDRGREIMDDIRATVDRMRARQSRWLLEIGEDVAFANRWLRIGVWSAALGVLLLGLFAFTQKRRQRLVIERHAGIVEAHSLVLEETNRRLKEEMETRQAAESQIRQMQKIDAIGQLTGGLAHDFNNMLAVVISAIGLVKRRLTMGDLNIEKYLDGAAEAADRAATLTRRLLAFSRQQPLAPEPIDANKMVSEMSEILRRTLGDNMQIETVLAGGLWRINADPSQLENSILNLAVNARDAMPDGGKITVETANAHLDDLYTAQNASAKVGQYVMIAMTDTGVGMTAEVAAKAFDPFFTTKGVGKGTGLGLSQVYGFVKQSGGHVKIYSEPGHGTTVKLYLPRIFAGDETLPQKPMPANARDLTGRTEELVLLVEDEERVRSLSVDALRDIGYSVIATDSGKSALKLLEENPGVVLLFTDIVMPEMSGRVLAEEALKMRPSLKVLYTTGFTKNAVVHNGVLDPGVNFLAKPFTIEELAAKVRTVIDG